MTAKTAGFIAPLVIWNRGSWHYLKLGHLAHFQISVIRVYRTQMKYWFLWKLLISHHRTTLSLLRIILCSPQKMCSAIKTFLRSSNGITQFFLFIYVLRGGGDVCFGSWFRRVSVYSRRVVEFRDSCQLKHIVGVLPGHCTLSLPAAKARASNPPTLCFKL